MGGRDQTVVIQPLSRKGCAREYQRQHPGDHNYFLHFYALHNEQVLSSNEHMLIIHTAPAPVQLSICVNSGLLNQQGVLVCGMLQVSNRPVRPVALSSNSQAFLNAKRPEPMPSVKPETRQLILDGAKRVVQQKGLAGATTREIAREVGCADGTLYVHFADRVDLFLALLRQSLPPMTGPLRELEYLAGRGTVRANLETVAHGALAFMREVVPLAASLFAEPELLRAHREELRRRNEGPHLSMAAVESYVRAEQRLRRINQRVNPKSVYALIFGACLHRVFISHFLGQQIGPSDEVFVKQVVATVVNGLNPE